MKPSEVITNYQSLFDNLDNTFRFDRGIVSVSDIAQQFYCEKEVHLKYEYPQEPTEEMLIGSGAHEKITTLAEKVSTEEAIKDALRKRKKAICIYEFGVGWLYKSVPILGRVDEVWFNSGKVELAIERKFSNSLVDYPSYHVQARLYCLSLEGMGFDITSTNYRIMIFRRSCAECPKLVLRACPIFYSGRDYYKCDEGETKIYNRQFNKSVAINDLDWALDYWLGLREPKPCNNSAKCRPCRQKSHCDSVSS